MEESIILAVEIDTKKALTQIDLLAQSVDEAKKNQEELNKQFKEGKISIDEYNQGTKENTKAIKSAETATKGLTSAVQAESKSVTALSAENKELIKQRNLISTATEEGRNKIRELNRQIDLNNIAIKENVSGLEKQRLNIGNYASALQGIGGSLKSVVPGLGGMTDGIMGITAGAKAFTATPFGATLQIIAGLLSVLIESFKGSEEGQVRLNKITQVTSALFGKFGDLIRDIGDFLIAAFENPKQSLKDLADFVQNNLVNRFKAFGVILDGILNLDFKQVANGVLQFGSGVEDVIGKIENVGKAVINTANEALAQGNRVAQLQKEIEDFEDEVALKRAKNDVIVSQLRERAIKEEGDIKRKTIEEAIALERQSAEDSVAVAQKKLELAQLESSIADNTKEANDALLQAEINLINAKKERYDSTLRFEKQLESLRDAELKAIEKQSAEEKKLAEQREAEYQKWIEREEDLLQRDRDAALERRLLQNEQLAEQEEDLEKRYELLVKNEEISRDFQLRFTDATEQEKQLIIEQSNAKIVALNKEKDQKIKDNESKTNAQRISAENNLRNLKQKAALDTLNFVTGLFNEGSKAQKIAALAEIAANVGIGISNGLRIAQETAVGTGPAAAFAFPAFYATQISAVLSAAAQARAIVQSGSSGGISSSIGGSSRSGVTATQATTNPINERFSLANTNQGMTVVASWKEATEVRNRVEFKESLITV